MKNKILVTILIFFLILISNQKTIAISCKYLLAFNDRNVKIIAEFGKDKDMDNLNDNDDDSNQDESNAETINNLLHEKQIIRLIDYANCNYINVSLKKVGLNQCNCNDPNLNFGKIRGNIPDSLGNTIDLAVEIEQTKSQFKQDEFSQNAIVKFLTEKIFEDATSNTKITKYYNNNKNKKEFDEAVNNIESFVFVNENNSNLPQTNASNTKTTNKKNNRSMLIIILLIFNFILSISAFALIINKYFYGDENKHSRYNKESENSNQIDVFELNKMIENKIENSKFKKELEKLREEIKSISISVKDIQKNGHNTVLADTERVDTNIKENIQQLVHHEIKYANGCEENGGFKVQYLTDTIQGNSCYVINITNQNATFKVIDNETAFKVIIDYPNDRLLPVCEVVGDSREACKIKTLTPGNLILDGDTWKLKTKAKVSYE